MASQVTFSTREFLRNFSHMNEEQVTIIKSRNKKKWVLIPYEKWQKKEKNRKVSIKELMPFFVKGGPKDVSERVDDIYT